MRYLYSLLFYLLIPFLLGRLFWRGRHDPEYRAGWKERLAYIKNIKNPCIWIHAVSLGESIAATPLIQALAKTYPNQTMVVTTNTATGALHLKQLETEKIKRLYVPYDLPSVIKRFLRKVSPQICIIMETELWPNLLHYTHQANIPILLANARLSTRSFKNYKKIKGFCKKMLDNISLVAAQSDTDQKHFCQLGMDQERVINTGNIKFDQYIKEESILQGQKLRIHFGNRPVFIAASTHEGEEKIILSAFEKSKLFLPTLLLILVPRHPERFQLVAHLCKKYRYKRRSQHELPDIETEIYLADTIGELTILYAASDIAFVGGSLTPIGGHNLLEPALLKRAVLSGPHLHHFQAIQQLLLDANALDIVNDVNELTQKLIDYLSNPLLLKQKGECAYEAVLKNRGALMRHITLIKSIINP